ncbi:MAG: hypothetical protein H6597_03700 [Flavobacteriales bacterium]|nr:hypothetical protein [Flavobacteriales bacterium]MCB9193613.1 hypothetical protein [Flavobacteriales bacterium]
MSRIPGSVALIVIFIAFKAQAQILVDRPIVLSGATDQQHQVTGLSDATATGDALNERTARSAGYRYVEANGTAAHWDLAPDPAWTDTLPAGADLIVRVMQINTGPVDALVNGLGPFPVVKEAGGLLDSADLVPGRMAQLVFDGTVFQLIGQSSPTSAPRPCPSGAVAVDDQFCIEVQQHDTMNFREAAITCGDLGGRLCTWGMYYVACAHATEFGIGDLSGDDWEWTNNSANGDGLVRVVGQYSCGSAATSNAMTPPARSFHCCFLR